MGSLKQQQQKNKDEGNNIYGMQSLIYLLSGTSQKNFFTIDIILHIGFSQLSFIRFKKFPSISSLLRASIRNECLTFSQSIEMIMGSLFSG